MPRITKADLEQRLVEKEEELDKYRKWLQESEEKYNRVIEEKTEQFRLLPEYIQMQRRIERLESMQKSNEYTIEHKKEKEKELRDKIQELLAENKQLKSAVDNQSSDTKELQTQIQELLAENKQLKNDLESRTVVSESRNVRGAGRRPISEEKVLQVKKLIEQGKKEDEICKTVEIARATYYRVKKDLLQKHSI